MSVLNFQEIATAPDAPNTSEVDVYYRSGEFYYKASDGVEHSFKSGVHGENFNINIGDWEETFTTTSWETYLGLTMPSSITGLYEIEVQFFCSFSSTSRDFFSRIALNGSDIGSYTNIEIKDSGSDQRLPYSYKKFVNLTGGEVLDLDFKTKQWGDNLKIYEGFIKVSRVQ